MKKLARIMSFVLAFSMIASLFVGAATKAPTKKPTATKAPTKKVTPTKAPTGEVAVNLGGYKWTIVSSWYTNEWMPTAGTERRDKIDAIINEVQKKFNCTIIRKPMGNNNATSIQTATMAGTKFADLVHESTRVNTFLFSKGYAYRLDTIKTRGVNLNVKDRTLFFQPATNAFNMDNRGIYAFSWASNLFMPQFGSIIIFNKQMVAAAGYNPYDLVRKGTWNYTNFEKISKACAKDTNGDGKPDILGSFTSSMNQNRVFLFTNNSRILQFIGGKYKYVGDSANTVESIDFLNKMINVEKCHMTKYDNIANYAGYEDSYSTDSFGQGKIAMMMPPWLEIADTQGLKSYLATCSFDWGVLPLPKGPKNTSKVYQSMITDPRVYFILTSNSITNVKKSAYIINALARRVNNDSWEAEMKSRLRDNESLEMIKNYVFPGLFMDIFMATEAAKKYNNYNGYIAGACEQILSRKYTAQAGMAKIKSEFQSYVDNVINNKLK